MSVQIGDLVILVRGIGYINPDAIKFLGLVRKVSRPCYFHKNSFDLDPPTLVGRKEMSWTVDKLKKIDPPSTGETREAYKGIPANRTSSLPNDQPEKVT